MRKYTLFGMVVGAAFLLASCTPESPGVPPDDTSLRPPESPVLENTIRVIDLPTDLPIADVPVLVNDHNGAVVQLVMTNERGTAKVVVPAGGMVSVFQKEGAELFIHGAVDPPAGSTITLPGIAYLHIPRTALTLSLGELPPDTKSVRYLHSSGQGTSTDLTQIEVASSPCVDTLDVAAWALDGQGSPLAWGTIMGISPAPGMAVRRDLVLDKNDFFRADLALSGAPTGPGVTASLRLDPRGEIRTRLPYTFARAAVDDPPEGRHQASLYLPGGLINDGVRSRAGYLRDQSRVEDFVYTNWVDRHRHHFRPQSPLMVREDLGELPAIHVDRADIADPRRPSWSWKLDGTARADMVRVYGEYRKGPIGISFTYQLSPRHPSRLQLPAMPASLSAWMPGSEMDPKIDHTFCEVAYYDYDRVDGFAEYLRDIRFNGHEDVLIVVGDHWYDPPAEFSKTETAAIRRPHREALGLD